MVSGDDLITGPRTGFPPARFLASPGTCFLGCTVWPRSFPNVLCNDLSAPGSREAVGRGLLSVREMKPARFRKVEQFGAHRMPEALLPEVGSDPHVVFAELQHHVERRVPHLVREYVEELADQRVCGRDPGGRRLLRQVSPKIR